MNFYKSASASTLWKGVDYYDDGRVLNHEKISSYEYTGEVKGNGKNYLVKINLKKPRTSTCNCAFAEGRYVVCKHMIALYFASIPGSRQEFKEQVEFWEEENQKAEEEHLKQLHDYVWSLSKDELRNIVLNRMIQDEEERNRRYYY